MSDPSKRLALRIHDEVRHSETKKGSVWWHLTRNSATEAMFSAPIFAHVDPIVSDLVVFSLRNIPPFGNGVSDSGILDFWKELLRVFASGTDFGQLAVIFGIEEAVKEAQNGGSGVVIYFRKEGRALGEVTKVRTVQLDYHDSC